MNRKPQTLAVLETPAEVGSLPKTQLLRQIREENKAFKLMTHFLDFDFFQFVWDFVSQAKALFKSTDTLDCVKFSWQFVMDMV